MVGNEVLIKQIRIKSQDSKKLHANSPITAYVANIHKRSSMEEDLEKSRFQEDKRFPINPP